MKIPSDSLGPLLHDAARLMHRRFEQQTADMGLSSAQWRLLIHVLREDGITQARLAEKLEIEPISVSRLLDRMEQAGWVRRIPHPTDRRVRQIVATEAAEAVGTRLKTSAESVYQEALSGLSPETQLALIGSLTTITQNLSRLCASCNQTDSKDD